MTELVKEAMVVKSPLSDDYFFFRQHRISEDGKSLQVVGRKDDVTESVQHLIEREIISFLRHVSDEYDLELCDPSPVTEEDGQKYTYGVREKTGFRYMEELIAEWRGKDG